MTKQEVKARIEDYISHFKGETIKISDMVDAYDANGFLALFLLSYEDKIRMTPISCLFNYDADEVYESMGSYYHTFEVL